MLLEYLVHSFLQILKIHITYLPTDHRKDPCNFIGDVNLWSAGQNQNHQYKVELNGEILVDWQIVNGFADIYPLRKLLPW